jgi:hemerythrin-like domain-containing protein
MSPTPPGHSAPGAGFEAPLEMLAACHGRIEHQCQTLRRLIAHLPEHGVDTQARDAARAVMRYFDSAARDHHADEEQELFPALLESMAGSDATCIREMTQALRAEHRVLEQHWHAVRRQLERVASGDAAALDALQVEALVDAYQRHIAREDGELLPMAARLLDDGALQAIGRAMRERRGVRWLP